MTLQPTFAASAKDWFDLQQVDTNTWLICEPGHANSYLMTSSTGSLLFDSGTGVASIVEAIGHLIEGPLTVVNSHGHLDHVGGNADLKLHGARIGLKEICAHPAASFASDHADREFLELYAHNFAEIAQRYSEYRALDSEYFFALAGQPIMREMPSAEGWNVPFVEPDRYLADGEVLEVGDRTFVSIHTPGHSPDSLVLFEPARKTLYAGDTVITAAMWCHGDGADLGVLVESLKRLEQLDISTVLCAHNLNYRVSAAHIFTTRRAAEKVLEHRTAPTPGTDLLGNRVNRHDADGITILLPFDQAALDGSNATPHVSHQGLNALQSELTEASHTSLGGDQ